MNTAELASRIGISPRTVRKWIKRFDIPCEKNEHGHYIFSEDDAKTFKNIQKNAHFNDGQRNEENKGKRKGIMSTMTTQRTEMDKTLQKQVEDLIFRMETNERKIDQKANEVVEYQLLQHRNEIDELMNRICALEETVKRLNTDKIEREIKQTPPLVLDTVNGSKKTRRKGVMRSIFGL
ncbi:MerR family transcriptional regulator [Bacillus timonensis]|nr:MerR family transcriptional regulator [Bacillus timonensis]